MPCDGNRLLPVLYAGLDTFYHNGSPEYRSVQHGTDGAVGALPHLMKIVLRHSGGVGGDGGAFHRHPVLLGGVGSVHGHLIPCLIPVLQAQIIIFCIQIHKRQQQFLLDHLPQDPCHLVSVHLHQGSFHGNFLHGFLHLQVIYQIFHCFVRGLLYYPL